MKAPFWTLSEAVELAIIVESVAPACGCHVALTGGCLYKPGVRKDCDLLFYRIRQIPEIDMAKLWADLSFIGVDLVSGSGWCFKASYKGKPVDCFFPEESTHGEWMYGEDEILIP